MDCEQPKVEATMTNHRSGVYTVCYSPDQIILCSAGSDKNVTLTNLQKDQTQKVLPVHVIGRHKDWIVGSDFSSNGNFLVTSSHDKTVRIWNVESENGNSTKLEGHSSYVVCVRYFHNDPMKVISGSDDNTIKIWDIERKKVISTLSGHEWGVRSIGHEWGVRSIDILPDNQTIVSGEKKNQMRIWDIRSGKCVQTLDHHKGIVCSVQFHPNTFSLASGSFDRTIKIFDFRTFQLLHNYLEHDKSVRDVCFHPSGKFLLSGSGDYTIKTFDLLNKNVLFTSNDHTCAVQCVQFSPDGKSFASGSLDTKVLLWNFPLGKGMRWDDKDIDEDERVNYLIQNYLLLDGQEDDCCELNNVLEIRIDYTSTLYCYKFFFI